MSNSEMDDVEGTLHERGKRFEELFYLLNDPLFENIGKYRDSMKQFSIKNNEKSCNRTIDYSLFGRDPDDIIKYIESRIDASLYTNKQNHGKRKGNELIKPNDIKRTKLISEIIDGVKQVNDNIINKDLKELDILSVPQHYPTGPHNVSSLAELYYLSQTLPLIKLLPGAHKSLTTESYESALLEGKIAVLYSRIEELKRQGKWSLRQPLKYFDPFTTKDKQPRNFHWDNVIREGKWMSIDFKEQTKFKKAACVNMAQAIDDYWYYGKDATCIKFRPIVHLPEVSESKDGAENGPQGELVEVKNEVDMEIDQLPEAKTDDMEDVKKDDPTQDNQEVKKDPEESETNNMEIGINKEEQSIDVNLLLQKPTDEQLPSQVIEPQELFTIPPKVEDKSSIFKIHFDLNDLKKIDQSIIRNLPKFTAFDDEETNTENQNLGSKTLKSNNPEIVTVSKLLYTPEEDDGFYKLLFKEKNNNKFEPKKIPDYQQGLFGTQNHRRFNYLKPPKPPLIKNIEYRSPTIWLPKDDKLLIHYVAEFCFNWDLISEHLSSTVASMKRYESNIERRTSWQCFERYIQLNEKFQFNDMKGPYSYNAQQWLEQAHRAQSTTKRRISPLGVGNESIQRGHRRLRWASMFDAIRKCMKKRETHIAKLNSKRNGDYSQQQAGNTNSSINGNATNNGGLNNSNNITKNDKSPTPAELSKLKYDRDKSIQEAYLNQQATRNRMMAAVAQQQKQQAQQRNPNQNPNDLNMPSSDSANVSQQSGQAPQMNMGNLNNMNNMNNMNTMNNMNNMNMNMNNMNNVNINQPLSQGGRPINQSQNIGNANGASPTNDLMGNRPNSSNSPTSSQAFLQQALQNVPHDANGRPLTPNGTPYTREQLQKLIEIQKRRQLMQYQQRQAQVAQAAQAIKAAQGGHASNGGNNNMMNTQQQGMIVQQQSNIAGGNNPTMIPGGNGQMNKGPMMGTRAGTPPGSSKVGGTNMGSSSQQVPSSNSNNINKPRIQFAPAQVSAIINSIKAKNPDLGKEQVTKLAASYLANLQQQQQNKLRQQQQQQKQQQQQQQNIQGRNSINANQQNMGNMQLNQRNVPTKQQLASLTPQERSQLQMMRAAKNTQQQQQLQQQMQQQQLQQQQMRQSPTLGSPTGLQSNGSSPVMTNQQLNNQQINNAELTRMEYEKRKRLLIKQNQQQQQYQQRSGSNQSSGSPGSRSSSS